MPLLGTLPPFIQRRAIGTIRRGKGVTRAGIVEAAVILVEAEGLEALTMRRLGAEVGVEAMSLYNHVANKHDVIVVMADHVLSGVAALADTGNAWDDAMALGQAVPVALIQHPNTTRLFAMNMTLQASDSIRLITIRGFSILGRLDLDQARAVHVFGVVLGFVIGHVLLELAQAAAGGPAASLYDPAYAFHLGMTALLAGLTEK